MAEGYGSGFYGTSEYGVGTTPDPAVPPVVIPLDPAESTTGVAQLKPLSIRLIDDVGIDIGTLTVSVGGVNWVVGGVEQNGATMVATLNNQQGYDLTLTPPSQYENGSKQEVSVLVRDVEGAETSFVFFFFVGIGPRLISIRNPMEGLILAHFNQPMLLNSTFFSAPNWGITPVSVGAAPLEVTEIVASAAQPDVAHIRYTGGGSTYLLKLTGILGEDGSPIEDGFNSLEFEIEFGEEDAPTVRLFDSVYGPLGVSQRARKRRTFDEFTANRSIALALDEQFRLRFQQLDDTIGRDGKNGKLRT